MSKLKWGLLGTGNIAHAFAKGVQESQSGELAAVGSRSQESADKFADEYSIANRHASYEALLNDANVDAIYISTPHPMHAEWAIKAARAKKHVLCEKPLTMNGAEAMRVVEAARQNNVILMEAFMYRCHPQTAKIVELLKAKVIGDVKLIRATFSFAAGFDAQSRLYNKDLGGGGILDVGCYTASMARLIAGAAIGQDFANPTEVQAFGHLGQSSIDEYTTAILKFPNDIVAQLFTGVAVNGDNTVQVFGTAGSITIPDPWFCGASKVVVDANGQHEEIAIEVSKSLYALEADAFAQAVADGFVKSPAMSPRDTLGNMETLDRWRKALKFEYSNDTLEGQTATLTNDQICVHDDAPMKYGTIRGLDKSVSRVVMGTMLEGSISSAATGMALYDDFFERGGNCFDTAHIYQGGWSETILGQWIKSRGVRDDLVIIAKGVHPPHDNPASIATQLDESLARLQIEYADIYMMHRDNESFPVSDWIDALNEQVRKGRITVFGGSNWSVARVREANEYAAKNGLQGFVAVSNNFSLARMVNPVWDGCISASDTESRAWFETSQIALMPWSSQARGFFVRGDKSFTADEELTRCWYSDDNFARLERVREMAKQKNAQPIEIALAYVLNQPFSTFPLIGARTPDEIRSSLSALKIELSPDELKVLNLDA